MYLIKFFLDTSFKVLLKNLSLDLCVTIIIEEIFLFLFGFCNNLLIDTLFFEKIFVMFDSTPGLSITSNRKYAEKNLSVIFSNLSFFLSFDLRENGNFIFPLEIEEISETKADVVAAAPAPSPCIVFYLQDFH